MTVNPDGVEPNLGCVVLTAGQDLRVSNSTNGFGQPGETITISVRGLPTETIAKGHTVTYPRPPADVLAPGQHFGVCSSEPGSQIDIWIR
jgi:hypothetical protein